MEIAIVLLIAAVAFFILTTLVLALTLQGERKIGRAALGVLDYVAEKYNVFGPYGFDCQCLKVLAVKARWERK